MKLSNLRQRLGLIYGRSQHDIDRATEIAKPRYTPGRTEFDMDLFRNVLLQAEKIVGVWGGKLYFVYLPTWQWYATQGINNKDRDRVLLLVKATGLPVIDIHKAFVAHGDPLALFPFRQREHYNEEGNRLVAEGVLRSITVDN